MYDVMIIGGGPAGMTAAIYAARACFNTILIEKQPMGGGQVLTTAEVDNYPGIPMISGFELGQKFSKHVSRLGILQVTADVISIDCTGPVKKAETNQKVYEARCLIYAAGASHRMLGAVGEEEFRGRGVSYCATCDGAFFKGKTVAVVGGGDTALEDALFLANVCKQVYLIHRRNTFRGAKSLQKRVEAAENIVQVLESELKEIKGDDVVNEIVLFHNQTKERTSIAVDGVFLAVGITPQTKLLEGQVSLDENGYVIAGENCLTNVTGVYAVGDVRVKPLRQILTAAADGANAVADLLK